MRALKRGGGILLAVLLALAGSSLPAAAGQCPGGESCAGCHAQEAGAVRRSRHATLAGIIGKTRYLWGAQPTVEARHGANGLPRPLPGPAAAPRGPATLVDDFLRAYCLDCHVDASGRDGGGCACCHAPPEQSVPMSRCLACHRHNHTGADYVGRFDADGTPVCNTESGVLRLAPDVHAAAGLACPDCHGGGQVMGLDREDAPSCAGCHEEGPAFLQTRDGRPHPVPRPGADIPGHDPALHGRVRCSACHGQWFFGEYGLSATRLDGPPPTGRSPVQPVDGLLAGPHGDWVAGWRFRRWETAPLGVDAKGRIAVLRPRHQYLVSRVDRLGSCGLDNAVPVRGDGSGPGWAFDPYTPHTTAPAGRPCHACHGNPEALGSAPDWAANTDFALLAASPPTDPRARLLNPRERERIMNPGPEYKREWALDLARRIGRRP